MDVSTELGSRSIFFPLCEFVREFVCVLLSCIAWLVSKAQYGLGVLYDKFSVIVNS